MIKPIARKEILSPAGNTDSFLVAIAAGADAIYCGLKAFSARMEAKNFSFETLCRLIKMAHGYRIKVYVTINSLITPSEIFDLRDTIGRFVASSHPPDALIVQDLSVVEIAQEAGFLGEIHLSTLANLTFPRGLSTAERLFGVKRIVLPRELSIDEMKSMSEKCSPTLQLEAFIHGALCYGVSGRCYWSSYLGGKSGLRGRCVQPCRRVYMGQDGRSRYFSCQDLSLDTLIKVLNEVPRITTWKIEGRKKSPHYVYYTVQAYRMLRDEFSNPEIKKAALGLLEMALGRKGTHYNFLPQRPRNPLEQGRDTGSGFQLGTVKGSAEKPFFSPRIQLLAGDRIRIGYEDQPWHMMIQVRKAVPRNGKFFINTGKRRSPQKGTPVFLTDRREPALSEYIVNLSEEMQRVEVEEENEAKRYPPEAPRNYKIKSGAAARYDVLRSISRKGTEGMQGVWLSADCLSGIRKGGAANLWIWLPPVIWPDDESDIVMQIAEARNRGARCFVLNAPWQIAFFDRRDNDILWAGPFCNTANHLAAMVLKKMGFAGVFVSPELGRSDVLQMPVMSPLPLGIVIGGNWPLCISRIAPEGLPPESAFTSPKGEAAWLTRYGSNYWVYPNWGIDLDGEIGALQEAGYKMLVTLNEPVPNTVQMKARPGLWNWRHGLL